MATISTATSLGVPGTPDSTGAGTIQADSLAIGSDAANTLTNRYTDLDTAGLILNAELTTQSFQYWMNRLDTGTSINAAAVEALDATDTNFNLLYSGGGQVDPITQGTWNLTNCRVLRRTTGGVYIFGRFSADSAWRANINGLILESYGGNITFHTGGLDVDNSTIAGLQLLGNSTAQLNAISAQFGFVTGNVADNQAFDNSGSYGGVDYGYSIRFVHQGSPDGNVSDNDAVPTQWALYSATDLRNIVTPGSDFATVNGAQSVIQINRNAAVWFLDPNMGNLAGEANAGRNMLVGFHNGNPPNSTNPAEIRTLISDRQTFQDSTGADVAGTKVRYSAFTLNIPDNYVRTTPPTVVTDNEITVDNSNYNGVMVQSQRDYLEALTGTTTAAVNSRSPQIVGNQVVPLRTDITRTVRNFRYDFPYETALTYDPNRMAGLVAATATRNEGVDLAAYLNSYATSADAPASSATITTIDDIFPALRRNWFEGAPTAAFSITGTGGNNLTFASAVSMNTSTLNVFNSDGTSSVRVDSSLTTEVINSLTFNATVSSIDGTALPILTIAGTGLLEVMDSTFADSTTLAISELRHVQEAHFANRLVFSPPNNLSTFSIASAQGDFTIPNIHRFEGVGFVELVKTSGDPITITVPAALNGDVTTTLTTGYRSGAGVTLMNAAPGGVDVAVTVQQAAQFGANEVNFDGWIYVVQNVSGTRTTHTAPVLVTDANRGNTFFSMNTNDIAANTSFEIYTAGARWNLARTTITNATTNAAPVATIIANTLYLPDATAVGTVDSVVLQLDDTLLVTTSGITDGSSEASNNRLAGDIKQTADYIQAMGVNGRTVDAVQYTSSNAVPPTFDISIITGATGDNTIQSWVGVGQVGTGTLAQTQQVNAAVWTLPNGTQGAQPSAINASVREAIDSAGVATRQDVIDNTEPLL